MNHFVSASCGGEKCRCGRPATHKIGEEIMHDEPCMVCGSAWRTSDISSTPNNCKAFYHLSKGVPRHNLTAYVCCLCFTRLLGKATGCPLTADEQKSLDNYNYAHSETGFSPTCELMCPACDIGKLEVEGVNETSVVIGCLNCGCGCHVANKEKNAEGDQGGASETDSRAQEGKDGPD